MIDEGYLNEVEQRINFHIADWERTNNRTPAQKAAWRVLEDLMWDPAVWASHGCPGDHKLDLIARRIAQEIESFAAGVSVSKEK